MELTVVIPTFNRRKVLEQTLGRLMARPAPIEHEVVVVDDGSTDDTAASARLLAAESPIPIQVLSQPNAGPAAARNRGAAVARGEVLFFLGDDIWPRPDLLERHLAFHRSNPASESALLGGVVWAAQDAPSPLMKWLNAAGLQFGYQYIEDPGNVRADFFYTANVSLKRSFFHSQGGFDEAFPYAALEDTELALRLAAAGMKLVYDPLAVGEHYHPIDLIGTTNRLEKIGESARLLATQVPGWRWFLPWHAPPRRDVQTLTKEALLAASHRAGIRPRRVRHATWWLLCEQSFRAGYSGANGQSAGWLDRRLLQYAARDRATKSPGLSNP